MVSILRSNQPIAWLIVPITGLCWLLLSLWVTEFALGSLSIQALGSLTAATLTHRIYVRYDFVERGDPALAWLSMVLLLLLMPVESSGVAIRSWTALLLLLAATDCVLQVHRQPLTSGLQFRSGALAALSVFLEPQLFGFVIAVAIVFGISRPFIFREWTMMSLGLFWIFALASTAHAFCPDLIQPVFASSDVPLRQDFNNRLISPDTARIWLIALSLWGALLMAREKSKISLRARTTRWHLMILFCVSIVIGMLIHPPALLVISRELPPAFDPNFHGVLDKVLAIGVAFGVVGLVPVSQRRHGASAKTAVLKMFVIVGSLLILFMPSV